MTDELSWALVASVTVEEGIKFLYGQLAELIKRACEKKTTEVEGQPPKNAFENAPLRIRTSPTDIQGREAVAERIAADISALLSTTQQRHTYSQAELVAVGNLRALMESLSGQRLTFAGECPRTAPIARIDAAIGEIEGRLLGIDASGDQTGRDYDAKFKIDKITTTASVVLFGAGANQSKSQI